MTLLEETHLGLPSEFDGGQELYQALFDIYNNAAWPAGATWPERRKRNVGPRGWRVEGLCMDGIGDKIFRRHPRTGPLHIYAEQLGLTILRGADPEIRLSYSSIPEQVRVTYDDALGVRTTTTPGEHYNLTVNPDGTVRDILHQSANMRQGHSPFTDRDRPRIEYDCPGLMPMISPEGAQKLDFTGHDIDTLHSTLGTLALDLGPLRQLNG